MKKNIHELAVKHFGYQTQEDMFIEELAECIHATMKVKRIRKDAKLIPVEHIIHLAEEIADVEIMIEQMKILHELHEKVDTIKKEKLKKLAESIGAGRIKHKE